MRYIFTLEQRDFFQKNHYIEFNALIPLSTISELHREGEEIIAKRLHLSSSQLLSSSSTTLYKAGLDLWRESQKIKKATQKLSIAHIASELFNTSPLRLGFDQLCLVNAETSPPFPKATPLIDISSVKPLCGAMLFVLENPNGFENASFPLPKTIGNGLFISPQFPIPWPELYATTHLKFFIVAFAPEKCYYTQETKDPHSPLFKKMGYAYNAFLRETTHPVIYGKK